VISPPEYVLAINPYVPGKPVEELERELGIAHSVKLASNENPVGPSPAAVDAIGKALSDINRYPDGSGYHLKKVLSERLSVSDDEIILGNGSNELVDIAVRTFMTNSDEAVMATPSFVVYSMAVQSVGGVCVQVPLKNHAHDLDAMAAAVTPRTRMLFIANPNNPTGTINKKDEFDRIMADMPDDLIVVVDEAYFEYVSDPDYADSMRYLHSDRNILILRTFSKIYGLAGLRLGYGISKKDIISCMNKLREPFNTSSVAQKAAIAALGDEEHLRRSREVNEGGKEYLYRNLKEMGVAHVPTEANFVYMSVPDAPALYEKMLRRGVIVRPMGPDSIRVTIGLPEENRRFVEALRQTAEGRE
jgi:histidinol-phosphate aminotransferase